VGKAGYIETPSYLFEQMVGTTTHLWALWVEGDVLHAEKKWVPGAPERVYHTMHRVLARHPSFSFLFALMPQFQPMQFWWKDEFQFELHEAPDPLNATRAVVNNQRLIEKSETPSNRVNAGYLCGG